MLVFLLLCLKIVIPSFINLDMDWIVYVSLIWFQYQSFNSALVFLTPSALHHCILIPPSYSTIWATIVFLLRLSICPPVHYLHISNSKPSTPPIRIRTSFPNWQFSLLKVHGQLIYPAMSVNLNAYVGIILQWRIFSLLRILRERRSPCLGWDLCKCWILQFIIFQVIKNLFV